MRSIGAALVLLVLLVFVGVSPALALPYDENPTGVTGEFTLSVEFEAKPAAGK